MDSGRTREQDTADAAFDPRLDPTGRRFAYVADGALHVTEVDGEGRQLVGEDDPDVSWGVAEFVAAEEMDRLRGYWWSPSGDRIVAARVDERGVDRWFIADPAQPDAEPRSVAYPGAGRTNAEVSLTILALDGGPRVDVTWDSATFPYLARVVWGRHGPLTLVVVTRRQDRVAFLTVDPADGTTTVVGERTDPAWVDLAGPGPTWVDDDRMVWVDDVVTAEDPEGTRRILLDAEPVTPPGLFVHRIVDASSRRLWFVASHDPQQAHVHRLDLPSGEIETVTSEPGWHGAVVDGDTQVVVSDTLDPLAWSADGHGGARVETAGGASWRVGSYAAVPELDLHVRFLELGPHRAPSALVVPSEGSGPWPVLLAPYGGPNAAPRSRRSSVALLERQWWAEQGFAVLVTDGRGTFGRSRAWERAVRFDLATPVLEDQVAALEAAVTLDDRLDPSRVAIRGWSFGGFLAALAVLRRPDVFHAAIVGAPVTDWHLYDTYYTERYLGLPDEHPEAYRVSSLIDPDSRLLAAADPPAGTRGPGMLLIHGLADDNVVAAHTLRLSAALLAAGRPHEVLPLPGVTHMTPQEVVAVNGVAHELDFLRRHLGAR